MLTYFRILVDKDTGDVKHCMTEERPLTDEKKLEETYEDTLTLEQKETDFIEWNGVIETDHFVRARELFNTLEDNTKDLDREPPFIASERSKLGTVYKMERYTKNRLDEDKDAQYIPDSIPDEVKQRAYKQVDDEAKLRTRAATIRAGGKPDE